MLAGLIETIKGYLGSFDINAIIDQIKGLFG